MNAIELLTRQHREVERLFARVEGGRGPDKQSFFLQLARALRLHTFLEEQFFYPEARQGDAADLVADSFDDHDEVERILAETLELGAEHQSFLVQLTDLREAVQAHVRLEEEELFPLVKQMLDEDELETLGNDMQSSAQEWEEEDSAETEPVEPQPQTLAEPPANSLDR